MKKSNIVSLGLAVVLLLISTSAIAENNIISWKLTIDQTQAPSNYHMVSSFIDAASNNVLGSAEANYPNNTATGHAYVYSTNSTFPVGYITASFAQLKQAGQFSEFYSNYCYDLNKLYNETVFLNFPQDFSITKPNCG